MFTFIKQNRLLTFIVAIFVFAVVYYAFFASKGDSNSLLSSSASANPSAQSQQLLVVLANLRTIRLNDAVFRDPVFLSLNDFGVVITPQNVGRRNPFAPFSPGATDVPSAAAKPQIKIPVVPTRTVVPTRPTRVNPVR